MVDVIFFLVVVLLLFWGCSGSAYFRMMLKSKVLKVQGKIQSQFSLLVLSHFEIFGLQKYQKKMGKGLLDVMFILYFLSWAAFSQHTEFSS